MSPEEIPGFDTDPELEALLGQNVGEMDEDTRIEVQRYKARKLKAKRDAGMSGDRPEWWAGSAAPETVAETDQGTAEAGAQPSQATEESPEPEKEATPEPEVAEAEESAEEEPEPTPEPPETEKAPAAGASGSPGGIDLSILSQIPGLENDPELDQLLTKNVGEMDEDTRIEVQRYKARILKAKRDAGMSADFPDWWGSPAAPETVEETDQESKAGTAEMPSTTPPPQAQPEESVETETAEEDQEGPSEPEPEPVAAETGGPPSGPAGTSADNGEESPKKAPPASGEGRYRGERKIGDLVESRTTGRNVSRRGFFSSFSLGVLGTVAAFGAGAAGSARFFFPNVLANPPESFVAGQPSLYPPNTVSTKFKDQYRVWLVNLGDRIVSILAICTHLGCTPNWLDGQGIFKCPCHGSGYYLNGVNFEGPAPRPMDRVGIRLNPQGQIIVDKSQVFSAQASPGWDAKGAYIAV